MRIKVDGEYLETVGRRLLCSQHFARIPKYRDRRDGGALRGPYGTGSVALWLFQESARAERPLAEKRPSVLLTGACPLQVERSIAFGTTAMPLGDT